MRYLTMEAIRAHLRLDEGHEEDAELRMLGSSAEDAVLGFLERTAASLEEEYGRLPAEVYHVTLMLVEEGYRNRGLTTPGTLHLTPFTVDRLHKYRHLT